MKESSSENSPDSGTVNNEYEFVLSALDQEQQQEQDISARTSSFIEGVDADLYKEREREYRDVEKHWVRTKMWLRTAQELARRKGRMHGLRYLTLPAYYRIDVSLLIREGLIQATQTTSSGQTAEVYVAAFEADPTKYGRMSGQSPQFKLFARTKVEDALTDANDQYFYQLRDLFPFDIVNLDLTTSLTPTHEGPYTKTMQAIETIFERQAGAQSIWALFLTFRNMPENWWASTIDQLYDNLQGNLVQNPKFAETFSDAYHTSNVRDLSTLDFKACTSQSVAKWLVDRAHHHRFKLDNMMCCKYTRVPENLTPYEIYKLILVFSEGSIHTATIPTKGLPTQSWMLDDLVACVTKHRCKDVGKEIEGLNRKAPHVIRDLRQDIDDLCRVIDSMPDITLG